MSAFTEIAYEKRGPVRIIRFNRPQVRNCIGAVTHRELVEAWTQFRDDESALVAIITGTGEKSFSTGGDLKPDLKPQRLPRSPRTIVASVPACLGRRPARTEEIPQSSASPSRQMREGLRDRACARRCEPQRQTTCLRRRLITRRREAIVALLPPR
jgi:enoyl-CoA hydratase/carnithine racemase